MPKSLQIKTLDGFLLQALLFEPKTPNSKLVLINSATGVPQQLYSSFAEYLCDNGYSVVTYDYRGIGLSKPRHLRGFEASMKTWGTVDYKAITDFIMKRYPKEKKYCLGHSVGALILGMNEQSLDFDGFVFVATQNAFIGNLDTTIQVKGYLGFGIVQPLLTFILGYFPAQYFGLGKALPAGCANDWRKLILHRKSINGLLEKTVNYAKELKQKTFVFQMEDDPWVTSKGVHRLLNETYPNLDAEIQNISISESPEGRIGHVNFFRSYNASLWKRVLSVL